MDNIKANEILQIISRIVKNRLLHLTFAGNILSIVKPAMLDKGINAYPILSLIGLHKVERRLSHVLLF